jgi:hypothetical protein
MKRSIAFFGFFLLFLFTTNSHADIISATSSGFVSVGSVTNAQVDFTNWNASGGCGGIDPCIVGASIIPISITEDGFKNSITFTYGPNFDFDYSTTGPGDRLILTYPGTSADGLNLDLTLTGASLYLAPAPQGIPDYGVVPFSGPSSTGVSSCPSLNPNPGNYCYTFAQDLTASSGSNFVDISLPFNQADNGQFELYLAVDGLNPNGGTFTINENPVNIAPEPTTFLLFGTGFAGLAQILRRKVSKNL